MRRPSAFRSAVSPTSRQDCVSILSSECEGCFFACSLSLGRGWRLWHRPINQMRNDKVPFNGEC